MPEVMAEAWFNQERWGRDTGSPLFVQGENRCPWSFTGGKNGENVPGFPVVL